MTRSYGDRAIPVALAIVSFGLIAAVFAVWSQAGQIRTNQAIVKQQQSTLDLLLRQSEQERQEREQLQSLVLRLQQQVRDLGGTPATLPPSPRTDPGPSVSATAGPSAPATPRARRTRAPSRPTPRPSRSPSSPSPSPSPSPSGLCLGPVCVGGSAR